MTEPTPDLIRAVRKGCDTVLNYGPDHPCIFPQCTGCKEGKFFRAALAELAEPSAEMVTAAAADRPTSQLLAKALWQAMMRKVLGEKP